MALRPATNTPVSGLPLKILLPNMITVAGLCAGVSAVRFAAQGRWETAVIAILVAALCDGLDGRIARLLRGNSQFGAELDSLADMVSFGIAPALVVYFWTFEGVKFGWTVCLMYVVCAALRLARFNTRIDARDLPPHASNFFVGVPTPAAALVVLMPLMFSFELTHTSLQSPLLNGIILVCVALLMVSRVPTLAFKKFRLPYLAVLPVFLGVAFGAGMLLSQPFLTLGSLGAIYLLLLPVGVVLYRRLDKKSTTAPHTS